MSFTFIQYPNFTIVKGTNSTVNHLLSTGTADSSSLFIIIEKKNKKFY